MDPEEKELENEVDKPEQQDGTDMPSGKLEVSNWDIFHMVFSILTSVIDIGLDINMAAQYLIGGHTMYFVYTLVLILLPSFINSVVSSQMHRHDEKASEGKDESWIKRHARSLFILAFQITPVIRYFYCLKYALKARKCKKEGDKVGQRRHYILMLREDQDVALIRVFECFMEAAPQQILQITIMIKHHNIGFNFHSMHQIGSIFSSLMSMGWAMASYHRSIRLAQWNKSNISKTGMLLQFLWHFFITVSRIVSICAVATISVVYASVACLLHWLGMTIWIGIESRGVKNFCRNRKQAPHTPLTIIERIHSVVFGGVLGIVYIFVYLNHDDGRTYAKHAAFYIVCGLENVAAALLWVNFVPAGLAHAWYRDIVPFFATLPFFLGIMALALYYKCFHPRSKNEKFYFQNSQPSAA